VRRSLLLMIATVAGLAQVAAEPATPVGAIAGLVVDRDGRAPLAGVTVVATPSGPRAGAGWAAAITDGDGRYRFEGLHPGRYTLTAYTVEQQFGRPNVPVRGGETTTVVHVIDAWPTGTERYCLSNAACPAWQVCSVSLGECDSALAPAEVCTGVCRAGWVHAAARVAGVVAIDGDADLTTAFGLEVVPPGLHGRLSVAADWRTDGAWRLGGAVWTHPRPGLAASVRIDAVQARGPWHAAAAGRLEWAPRGWPFSVMAELGAVAADGVPVFATVGLAGWLRLP